MIDTPQLIETTAQFVAKIHLTVPRNEIRSAMGTGVSELMAAVKAQGIGPAGPLFEHHLKTDPLTFDFELCVPVTSPVVATGRVEGGRTSSVKVVGTIYHGGYEGLGAAWQAFNTWLAANGFQYAPDFYQRYLAGPESSPDPANWRTELSRPLAAQ